MVDQVTEAALQACHPATPEQHAELLIRARECVDAAVERGQGIGDWSGATRWAIAVLTLEATHRAGVAPTDCKNKSCRAVASMVGTLEATLLQWRERAIAAEEGAGRLDDEHRREVAGDEHG